MAEPEARAPLLLMYHSVAWYDSDPFQVTVSPARFAEQMRWMARRGLRCTSVQDLLRGRTAGYPASMIGLTFDDGYQDFWTEVVPILREHDFTSTVFVVAGRLGDENWWDRPGPRKRMMTPSQVRAAAEAGMEIGSHGLRHIRLPGVDDATLLAEVTRSRAVLEEIAGRQVTGFAYPYGAVTGREAQAVSAAGYDYACGVGRSVRPARYALQRTYVGDRDGSLRLLAKWARHRLGTVGAGR